MIDWIISNYEWVFSGLGVFLLAIVIRFTIRRQMRRRATIENIRIGDKTQVSIVQFEGDVQISYPSLRDMNSEQMVAGLLEGKRPETLKLETKLANEKEIYDPEKRKATEYNCRAFQLNKEGKYNEGLINIRKAIDIDPEEELYKENLVTITENYASALALNSSRFDETIALMERLREEESLNDGGGYWILGYAYSKKELHEQAIAAYQQTVIFEPKDHLHHLFLAEAYSHKGIKDNGPDYKEEALKEIELSLRLNPQGIKGNDPLQSSFAELILLDVKSSTCSRLQIEQ